MNPITRTAAFVLAFLTLTSPAFAGDVIVAAASDLSFALKEITAEFQKKTGHTVKLTFGSSGSFYAQILNGAPYDVFLSADVEYARDLERKEFADRGSVHIYAVGRLALWVPKDSPIDVRKLGLQSLLDARARKVAIANPEHAPYGRAAVAAMEKSGVYVKVKPKLVLGENISQAAQFVQSGAADIGLIALSIALSETMKSQGVHWEIPASIHPRMDQGAVVLKQARKAGHAEAARQFLEMLRSPAGRAVLQRYGFVPANADPRR